MAGGPSCDGPGNPGAAVITVTGLLVSAAGIAGSALAAAWLPAGTAAAVIAGTQLVNGLGSGMVISPNHVLLLVDVPAEKGGLAASIGHLTQRIGNSLGLAATSAAFYSVICGSAGRLSDAGRSTSLRALGYGYATAGVFFALALAAAAGNMPRIWRTAHGAAPVTAGGPTRALAGWPVSPGTPVPDRKERLMTNSPRRDRR